jgi:hypothetical protein
MICANGDECLVRETLCDECIRATNRGRLGEVWNTVPKGRGPTKHGHNRQAKAISAEEGDAMALGCV